MSEQTVKTILTEWLKENGCDGFCNDTDECGCFIDDLIPCGNDPSFCEPGVKQERDGAEIIVPRYEKGGG